MAVSNASAADPIHEVANIEAAMAYVDEVVQAGQPITEHLVRELHAQTVQGLRREGDPTPSAYRSGPCAYCSGAAPAAAGAARA